MLLDVHAVTRRFGGLRALADVDVTVEEREIRAIIGPNGAGKTTFFNCVTGVYRPDAGSIVFEGESIIGRKPHAITRRGIARTFQNIRLFGNMTALENVQVGGDAHRRTGVPGAILRTGRFRREEQRNAERAHELLRFVGIGPRAGELARSLPYGDQRRLEIARALATEPRLLMLDEPAAGMNAAEKAALMSLIRTIRDRGVTIVLIEHDMRLVMGISERVTVLDHGERIADGTPQEVQNDPRVIEAYLGRSRTA